MRKRVIAVAGAALMLAGHAMAAEDVMVVFDGSNSMWGQIEGTAKIEIARDAMNGLIGDWTQDANIGLMAYGHRREADCGDIETVIAPSPFDRERFLAEVGSITPRGKTPLTSAVREAAEALSYRDNPATVVLITDGIESCQGDPCALAGELEQMGVAFTAHVVGFDLKDEEQAAVACMAERTGGLFVPANDAGELATALSEVGAAVAEVTEPEPLPVPEPEPAPEPEPEPEPAPAVTLEAPGEATIGASFDVSWDAEEQMPRDYITIVPAGSDEGAYTNYTRVREDSTGSLRAPDETGFYEVRYVRQEDGVTLGATDIEIVDAAATVEAPESATTGERFDVSWAGAVHPRDYVTIVPMGADEGSYLDYTRVRDDTEGRLQAPADAGLYEVRYVLNEGGRTLASAPIEIVDAAATVEAPESATAGERFDVSWTGAVHPRDYVTIVPMGADEGSYLDYTRVRDDTEGRLQAPADAGLYEVRYVLNEGSRTLASAPIEITEATASIKAPKSAVVGSAFPVQWSRAIHPRDYATIVPVGAAEGEYGDYTRLRDDREGTLRAPAQAGLYEVRYVLDEGRRVLASVEIEIVEADIELTGPDTVRAGTSVRVGWSGTTPHPRDWVTIVPAGSEEGAYDDYVRVRENDEADLAAPEQTGLYEVRYVLDTGNRTLARHMLEVVDANAQLNDGGTLEAPEAAAPGETVEVNWTAESGGNDQRITLAAPDQADFTWIEAQRASEGPLSFTLPDELGFYEFRLLDVTERKVLSRVTVSVD